MMHQQQDTAVDIKQEETYTHTIHMSTINVDGKIYIKWDNVKCNAAKGTNM